MAENKYKYVFIVLVYRNINVLEDFLKSLNLKDSKVIVVESYFDNETSVKCNMLTKTFNFDYISIPNKGYGYGNNIGIQFALDNYEFEYLIISNSDIIIEDIRCLENLNHNDQSFVIAPKTTRKADKKQQNPNMAFQSTLYYRLLKEGYSKNHKFLVLCGHIISRVSREITLLYSRLFRINILKVFSPHGSFIIFSEKAIRKLNPLFNEDMFLYNEELFVAYKCRDLNIPVYYIPCIKVTHLEGASTHDPEKEFARYKQSFNVLDEWLTKKRIKDKDK